MEDREDREDAIITEAYLKYELKAERNLESTSPSWRQLGINMIISYQEVIKFP